MAYWERNFILIGAATLLTAAVYFGIVVWQSLALGAITPPSLLLVLGCLMLQVFASFFSVWTTQSVRKSEPNRGDGDVPPEGMDERDRFVKLKSEASASHFYYLFLFTALIAWFAHENPALMFHSFVGAFFLGDLVRAAFQLIYYNKAY